MGAASSVAGSLPETLTKEATQKLVGASWDEGAEAWFNSECDSNGLITGAQFKAAQDYEAQALKEAEAQLEADKFTAFLHEHGDIMMAALQKASDDQAASHTVSAAVARRNSQGEIAKSAGDDPEADSVLANAGEEEVADYVEFLKQNAEIVRAALVQAAASRATSRVASRAASRRASNANNSQMLASPQQTTNNECAGNPEAGAQSPSGQEQESEGAMQAQQQREMELAEEEEDASSPQGRVSFTGVAETWSIPGAGEDIGALTGLDSDDMAEIYSAFIAEHGDVITACLLKSSDRNSDETASALARASSRRDSNGFMIEGAREDARQAISKDDIESFVQFIMSHGDVVRNALAEAAASRAASRRTSIATATAEAVNEAPAAAAALLAGTDSTPAAAAAVLAAEAKGSTPAAAAAVLAAEAE